MSTPPEGAADRPAADLLEDVLAASDSEEHLSEGGTQLLDLVAAIDYLSRGLRPDFTVWDALEEAVDWWLAEESADGDGSDETSFDDAHDPLTSRLDELVRHIAARPDATMAAVLQAALRRWLAAMAERYNAGYEWPHPVARRSFPPSLIADDTSSVSGRVGEPLEESPGGGRGLLS
jgi:hypothetical protein